MSVDKEILEDFVSESKDLLSKSVVILEDVEEAPDQAKRLADYGNLVDRIMGAAASIAVMADKNHTIHMIRDYTAVCKAVGYKSSQIVGNDSFFNACVGLLMDATEMLGILLDQINKPVTEVKQQISSTFIDRLQWVSRRFSRDFRASVEATGADLKREGVQDEIDELLKRLGVST